jgi:hypothetical protein
MTSLRITVLLLFALAGCETRSAKYCAANPDDPACGGMNQGSDSNTSSCGECTAPRPFCDPNNECVQCITTPDCDATGTAPVCDQEVCRGCTAHSECASNACLPNGACGTDDDVAYVDPVMGVDGGNKDCNKATPCKSIAAAIAAKKPNIKLTGVIDEPVATDKALTFISDPGTRLTASTGPAIFTVMGGAAADVKVFDLAIGGDVTVATTDVTMLCVSMASMGKLAMTNVQIAHCSLGGVTVAMGDLTMSRSHVFLNRGGGIYMLATANTFNISNTFVVHNGDAVTGTVPGVWLTAASTPNTFDFNTVADNQIKTTAAVGAAGVEIDLQPPFVFTNIIGTHNTRGSSTPTEDDTFGAGGVATSFVGADIASVGFTDTENEPFQYTLKIGSVAIDHGTTPSAIDLDQKGVKRPQQSGKDQGADEFKP